MIAQLGGPNRGELSQMLQNIVVIESRAAYLCVTSESSRAGIARAPWSACPGCWSTCTVAKPVRSQRNASIAHNRRAGARHCRLAPPHSRRRLPWCRWPPRRASRVRASSWALAPSSPKHTVAPEDSPLRSVCQNSASDAPDAFAAAALAALIDAARGVPIDDGIRYSTWTWYHHHTRATFVTKGSLGHDEHALPGRALLAPAPSQAAAHLVTPGKK